MALLNVDGDSFSLSDSNLTFDLFLLLQLSWPFLLSLLPFELLIGLFAVSSFLLFSSFFSI